MAGLLLPDRGTVKPYLADPDVTLYCGDALETLRELPDESVHCVVTSPPYWGLRDYGTGLWEGGDPECEHRVRENQNAAGTSTLGGGKKTVHHAAEGFKDECPRCGARRVDNQLGLEPTPELYVARMVDVFHEVRRVLADYGTLWLNLGDSYARTQEGNVQQTKNRTGQLAALTYPKHSKAGSSDGWYLRSDIIWSKPNPMPESVTDRPTKSHEYVFLLTKAPRYFFDQEAVREPYHYDSRNVLTREAGQGSHENHRNGERNRWPGIEKAHHAARASLIAHGHDESEPMEINHVGRNVRSVWEIATQPYPEAHFATYPEELVRRCVLAGCPEGGTVLDPFAGSGTTLHVARKHGRRSIGIELNPAYCKLAADRLAQQSLLAEAR